MQYKITIGDKYGPAMEITDQAEADQYFAECVNHTMSFGRSREEAERIEKENLGFYAGYYDSTTRSHVEKLFRCSHPIFGAVAENGEPTGKQAFELGYAGGKKT